MITNKDLFTAPNIFRQFSELIAVQSTRHGGLSPYPSNALNLGLYTPDTDEHVLENRKRFFDAIGISESQTASAHQIHKDEILLVGNAGKYEGYDALITSHSNLFLSVTAADCTPILIYDAKQKIVAAIHAGWRGTVINILEKTVKKILTEYNSASSDLYCFIGICIDECSYEVNEDVAQHFSSEFARWDESKQKYFVDLKKANQQQLLNAGIPRENIEVSPYSTVLHNEHFFSHRKEKGNTGRMLAVIGRKF